MRASPPAGQAAASAAAHADASAGAPVKPVPLRTLSVSASLRTLRLSFATLHQLAASSRGPHGGVKLLHMNPLSPSVSLSQSSSVLTSSLSIAREHTGVAVLLNLVSRAADSSADQGATMLHIATGLLGVHYDSLSDPAGARPPIPVPIALAGHQLALQWCLDFLTPDYPTRQATAAVAASAAGLPSLAASTLPHPVASIQLSNLPALLALIRSQLASKQALLQLSDADRQCLAVLTLQAFLQGLQKPGQAGTGFAANIRVHELPVGLSVQRSSVVDGVVLDTPLPIHRPLKALQPPGAAGMPQLHTYVNLVVAMYNINLTFAESEHFSADVGVRIVGSGSHGSNKSTESTYQQGIYAMMRTLVARWRSLRVTLLACQKVIHPFLKQLCLEAGILPLERLSIRHMEAVKQVAGGEILSGIDGALCTPVVLGRIARLEEKLLGRRRFIFLTPASPLPGSAPNPAAGVLTFLLSAPTLVQQSELAMLLQRVFKILTHMLRTPAVCAGAGSTEMQLATHIRRQVKLRRTQHRNADAVIDSSASLSGFSSTPADFADELASLEHSLRSKHALRSVHPTHLLSLACLQLADVLEHVACFSAWNSERACGGDSKARGGMLLGEFQQRLRTYHEPSNRRARELPLPSRTVPCSMSPPAVPPAESIHFPHAATDTHPTVLPPGEVQRIALLPDADPLPEPSWHADKDWRLTYESRSAGLNASATPSHVRDRAQADLSAVEANALYGCHLLHTSPAVVWRVHAETRALQVDAHSVLDPLYAKRRALQVAVEAAAVLMRVDQVVHAVV